MSREKHRASDNNPSWSALTTGPLQHLSLFRKPLKARAGTFHPDSTAQALSVPGSKGYKSLLLLAKGNTSVNGRHQGKAHFQLPVGWECLLPPMLYLPGEGERKDLPKMMLHRGNLSSKGSMGLIR